MKFSSIRYLLSEGVKNVWRNWMMSIASIGVLLLCLLLTGASVLLSANLNSSMSAIEKQNVVKIYLKDDVDSEKAAQIGETLSAMDNVASCEFYSKEQAVEKFRKELGSAFESMKDNNPLPDAYKVSLNDISQYNSMVEQIKAIDGVESVVNRSELFERLTKFDRFVSLAGMIIVVILALVSLFIITNTIRLTMYNRRFEISIMKSVGATDWFVRIPFMVEGVVIGIISAIISSITLKFFYDFIIKFIKKNISFFNVGYSDIFWPLFLSFLLAGILFGLIGGLISISKYLKKEGGEILGW